MFKFFKRNKLLKAPIKLKKKKPASIKFSEIESELKEIIKNKYCILQSKREGFAIVQGFFNTPIHQALEGNIIIGGPSVPMVAIVGQESGLIHFFALKVLMPELDI